MAPPLRRNDQSALTGRRQRRRGRKRRINHANRPARFVARQNNLRGSLASCATQKSFINNVAVDSKPKHKLMKMKRYRVARLWHVKIIYVAAFRVVLFKKALLIMLQLTLN